MKKEVKREWEVVNKEIILKTTIVDTYKKEDLKETYISLKNQADSQKAMLKQMRHSLDKVKNLKETDAIRMLKRRLEDVEKLQAKEKLKMDYKQMKEQYDKALKDLKDLDPVKDEIGIAEDKVINLD